MRGGRSVAIAENFQAHLIAAQHTAIAENYALHSRSLLAHSLSIFNFCRSGRGWSTEFALLHAAVPFLQLVLLLLLSLSGFNHGYCTALANSYQLCSPIPYANALPPDLHASLHDDTLRIRFRTILVRNLLHPKYVGGQQR